MVPNLKGKSYEERLKSLKLPTLDHRRKRGDLIQTYKIMNDIDKVKSGFFKIRTNNTRGHRLKIFKDHCHSASRRHFFSNRVVDSWNSLPEVAINAESVNAFKNQIDKTNAAGDKYLYKNWNKVTNRYQSEMNLQKSDSTNSKQIDTVDETRVQ